MVVQRVLCVKMYKVTRKLSAAASNTIDVLGLCRVEALDQEISGLDSEPAYAYGVEVDSPMHRIALEKLFPAEVLLKYASGDAADALNVHMKEGHTLVECHTRDQIERVAQSARRNELTHRRHFEVPFTNLDGNHWVLTASVTYQVRIVFKN